MAKKSFWLALVFLVVPLVVWAAEPADYYVGSLVPCGINGELCTLCHFVLLARNIFEFLLKVSLALGIVFGVVAGVMYVTSAGSENLLKMAKEAFWATLWGFLIMALAWLLVTIVAKLMGYQETWSSLQMTCESYKAEESPEEEDKVCDYAGYGAVNNWMNVDAESLASELSSNGLNATHIEFLGYGEDCYYKNPSLLYEKTKGFISAMRAKNITTFVNMMNWNYGEGLGENTCGADGGICGITYSDAWFAEMLDFFKDEIGTDKVVLQAASEWGPNSRNSDCWEKAETWDSKMNQEWSGKKSYNKESRPTSAPSGYYLEYHPMSTTDTGYPTGKKTFVTTDTSGILQELNNGDLRGYAEPEKLAEYACSVMKTGTNFIYYGFGHDSIDTGAIKAMKECAELYVK